MKKTLSIFFIVLITSLLVFASFSGKNDTTPAAVQSLKIDLEDGQKIYSIEKQDNTHRFVESSGALAVGQNGYYRLSPVDGIYFRSGDPKSIKLTEKSGRRTITFPNGLFICSFLSPLVSTEISLPGGRIRPVGPGVFAVSVADDQIQILSISAFIDSDLLSPDNKKITSFRLFPSFLFSYHPENNQDLVAADIVRIATIDSIRYLDVKDDDNLALFLAKDRTEDLELFRLAFEDISNHRKDFSASFDAIMNVDSVSNKSHDSDMEDMFFINDTKRDILLKNELVKNIREVIQWKQKNVANIKKTLDTMNSSDPRLLEEGKSILRKYLAITLYASIGKTELAQGTDQTDSVPLLLASAFDTNTYPNERYYPNISILFLRYYFSNFPIIRLNASYSDLLGTILSKHGIKKEEYLSFSFFVTEYLSSSNFILSTDTFNIISNLFALTEQYYRSLDNDDARSSALSTLFYNYNKIFVRLYHAMVAAYFDDDGRGLYLKPQYVSNGVPAIPSDVLDSFLFVTKTLENDLAAKKQSFYTLHAINPDVKINDNYTILYSAYTALDRLRYIFGNYGEYTKTAELNDRSRTAHGIIINKTEEMSRTSLEAYLSGFTDLNTSTIDLLNNFKKDGFYDMTVMIASNRFAFKLYPEGHTISDISYTTPDNKKQAFPNVVISLDSKRDQMRDMYAGAADLTTRAKYDFKNIFSTVFLAPSLPSPPTPPITASTSTASSTGFSAPEDVSFSGTMPPEMQLFVQKELVDKDFKNIADFLPIGFSNIFARIENGNYVIDLAHIAKSFPGNSDAYGLEFQSKYVFDRHAFFHLAFRVKKQDVPGYQFNGVLISIVPSRILLTSLQDTIKDLGEYIDLIRKNYQNEQTIEVDFSLKRITLDGKVFDYVPIPKQ